jgi:hypothetical protein
VHEGDGGFVLGGEGGEAGVGHWGDGGERSGRARGVP